MKSYNTFHAILIRKIMNLTRMGKIVWSKMGEKQYKAQLDNIFITLLPTTLKISESGLSVEIEDPKGELHDLYAVVNVAELSGDNKKKFDLLTLLEEALDRANNPVHWTDKNPSGTLE
jgi:hypothetical protein